MQCGEYVNVTHRGYLDVQNCITDYKDFCFLHCAIVMAKSQTQESGFSTLGVQNNLACFCKSKLKQMFTSNLDSRYSVVSFCQVFCQVYSVTLDGDTITCFYTVSSTLRDKQQNQKQ